MGKRAVISEKVLLEATERAGKQQEAKKRKLLMDSINRGLKTASSLTLEAVDRIIHGTSAHENGEGRFGRCIVCLHGSHPRGVP
eukprot:2636014-Lingulodinium_polyedra.AAC.1